MYFIISIMVIVVDQICKLYVKNFLSRYSQISVLNGLLKIVYLENTGAAFGILKNSRYIFIISTLVIVAGLLYVIYKKNVTGKIFKTGAALIVGGGLSNLIDRVFLGYVVDYIKLSFFAPVCNIADYCITAGTVLLVIYILKYSEKGKNN